MSNEDICMPGFVWREAFPGDLVCVPPETRAQARLDNSQAAARRDPNGAFGPDTCIAGFVWRGARPGDHVCVTPETRAQTAEDNRLAPVRRLGGHSTGTPMPGIPEPGRKSVPFDDD